MVLLFVIQVHAIRDVNELDDGIELLILDIVSSFNFEILHLLFTANVIVTMKNKDGIFNIFVIHASHI